ncbi:MAG: hypothetical protein B7X34_00350, partial [Acidobacteriia bacterium 12-62-4]
MLLALASIAVPSLAQITGDLVIRVSDPSSAAIVGAKVSIRSSTQGFSRDTVTDAAGTARFSLLTIGDYSVRVENTGFSSLVTTALINSGSTKELNVTLEVSSTKTEVVIEESALTISTASAQMQTSVESKAITQLPLQGGPLALAGTTPITIDNANASDVSTTGGAGIGTVPIDGIKEVNVISNNFSAEYGRNGSSQYQILTKSGTNDFHGRLFEFFRNDKLNSRDYFDRTGKAPILRDNQWGAAIGGRIVRDKLFYFGTYEQQKIRGAGGTRIALVPTNAQVAGITNPAARALWQATQGVASDSGTVSNAAPLGTN